MNCRFCQHTLTHEFIDMVNAPASNSFLTKEQLAEPETFYPLKVMVCEHCFLVQVDEYKKSDSIFDNNYVYFSSFSSSWLAHAKLYTEQMIARFGFNAASMVIEIASNDGYLLQYFKEKHIPVLGIEPTANTAQAASQKGIESIVEFMGLPLANDLVAKNIQADLLLGNNVLAHVPDIVDFVAGMKILLKNHGVITMEFPHLMQLIANKQFDTIYHEHFSYLSFYTVTQIFEKAGLEMFDVEELQTHGGSLRIYARHKNDNTKPISKNVKAIMEKEMSLGVNKLVTYSGFQKKAEAIKFDFLSFLIEEKKAGKTIAAYGAAAKGNTLLNYCGIKNDLIDFVVDANPHKQSKYLPASHIPVMNENYLKAQKPDYIIILPWNIKKEITDQLHYIRDWGGKFVTAIPMLEIF